jgi:hypothetical protein
MSDLVHLLIPTDERFRAIGPELAGKFCLAEGGTDADAASLSEAVTKALNDLSGQAESGSSVAMDFRTPEHTVEVTLSCCGRSSLITHPLPAPKG